ncbi:hypothetical protein [Plebeiibacterium sediminum]|uniref:Uncharacterized protein n=1 Tax=Plebeiibacterium sediminum TaxID=2992112 RepID=A0AAE3SDH2_9BACT|nr:hypothetical protein [Plebeiobacterium sediminum]MCW3785205.1 hypothetical protein [Plebeiobacterium sediminum]
MKRIRNILAVGFASLMLFINVGLTLTLNLGLHVHFLGDNQILVHYHTTAGTDKPHHSQDTGCSSHYSFSTTITYLNNAQGIHLNNICAELNNKLVLPQYSFYSKKYYHCSPLRAPPIS